MAEENEGIWKSRKKEKTSKAVHKEMKVKTELRKTV